MFQSRIQEILQFFFSSSLRILSRYLLVNEFSCVQNDQTISLFINVATVTKSQIHRHILTVVISIYYLQVKQ